MILMNDSRRSGWDALRISYEILAKGRMIINKEPELTGVASSKDRLVEASH
jgi:hypothetical protein